jgi:hypothetical protein
MVLLVQIPGRSSFRLADMTALWHVPFTAHIAPLPLQRKLCSAHNTLKSCGQFGDERETNCVADVVALSLSVYYSLFHFSALCCLSHRAQFRLRERDYQIFFSYVYTYSGVAFPQSVANSLGRKPI